MFVAGIDAHATYSVIAIVSNTGELVQKPVRRRDEPGDQACTPHADDLLQQHQRQPQREQHAHDEHGDEAHSPPLLVGGDQRRGRLGCNQVVSRANSHGGPVSRMVLGNDRIGLRSMSRYSIIKSTLYY